MLIQKIVLLYTVLTTIMSCPLTNGDPVIPIQPREIAQIEREESNTMQMTIEGVTFTLYLIENPASQTLLANLPLTLTMDDLHRNEKYASLDQSYPTQPQSVGQINAGDVMLFGSNTLVIFYDSFSTSYAYTPMGQISEVDQLISLLNHNQSVEVHFTLE